MAHILLGLLRYFNIYPVCDVWRKVCQKKVVIFNFRRRRGIYLDSTLEIVKPSKSGEQILFKSNLLETFVKSNILWLSGAKINFALTFLVLQLFELPLIVVRYYWDLDLIMRQIPWCSNLIFLWRIVFCCHSDSEFPPVLI